MVGNIEVKKEGKDWLWGILPILFFGLMIGTPMAWAITHPEDGKSLAKQIKQDNAVNSTIVCQVSEVHANLFNDKILLDCEGQEQIYHIWDASNYFIGQNITRTLYGDGSVRIQ